MIISSLETQCCCLKTPTRGPPPLFSYPLAVDCECLKDVGFPCNIYKPRNQMFSQKYFDFRVRHRTHFVATVLIRSLLFGKLLLFVLLLLYSTN